MKNIKAIMLFGSSASDEMDSSSDIDVFLVSTGDFDVNLVINEIKKSLVNSSVKSIEIANYSEDQFSLMLLKGSLFAHHLKSEGRVILGKEYLANQFQQLIPFESFEEELSYYNEIFQQILEARIINQNLVNFDYSLMFTLVRNICILLSNFNNEPRFGRRNAFLNCLVLYKNFPVNKNIYYFLESAKLIYDRGIENLNTVIISFDEIQNSIVKLIELAKKEFYPKSEIKAFEAKTKQIVSLAHFGFKERMSLEKTLFSILKTLTHNDISGFNSKTLNELKIRFENNQPRVKAIHKLFELRNFIKEIASSNAYVRDIALENAATDRLKVFDFLNKQIKSIEREVINLSPKK